MQIPNSTYRISTPLLTALSEGSASKNNGSIFSLTSSASTPTVSTSTTTAALQASLAATALDKADPPLSRVQTIAGVPSPALAAALSKGHVVNPADWLTQSDVKLFEQTTGYTMKDGFFYDKEGNQNPDPAAEDLVCALFDMRNFGTYSPADQQPRLIKGDITAQDLKDFMQHYQKANSQAYNLDMLGKALDVLTAKEA